MPLVFTFTPTIANDRGKKRKGSLSSKSLHLYYTLVENVFSYHWRNLNLNMICISFSYNHCCLSFSFFYCSNSSSTLQPLSLPYQKPYPKLCASFSAIVVVIKKNFTATLKMVQEHITY